MLHIPKFVIDANTSTICKLVDEYNLYALESAVLNSALNACSRGVVRLGYDPKSVELVLAVHDRVSPILGMLASQCGDPELACALLYLYGAAVELDTYNSIRKYL
jgi:hypothetical protein